MEECKKGKSASTSAKCWCKKRPVTVTRKAGGGGRVLSRLAEMDETRPKRGRGKVLKREWRERWVRKVVFKGEKVGEWRESSAEYGSECWWSEVFGEAHVEGSVHV